MLKYKKTFGFLAILFSMIFTINVKALKTTSGTLPDLPNNEKNYVIVESENKIYVFVVSEKQKVVINNNSIQVNSTQTWDKSKDSENWHDSGNDYSHIFDKVLVTTNNIYNNSDEIIYESGYGLPLPSFFAKTKTIISSFLTAFGVVVTSMLGNILFQIIFGIVILFLCIGLVYGAVKKTKNRGR